MSLDFPAPIIDAIKSLTSKIRRQILIEVHNRGPLSYTELRIILGAAKGNLNFHLNILVKAGMIQNYLAESSDNEHSSFYKISDTGNTLVEAIFSAFEPQDREHFEQESMIEWSLEQAGALDGESFVKVRDSTDNPIEDG